uniref:Uncharacterized protein n=1 Tax=Zooxanthella nutricula TaxID=1333877 RepID=A0A7S2L5N6_9DINO
MPAYLKDYIEQSQPRKDILIEMITMQVCPSMYSDHTKPQWAPQFTTKLSIQQRVQYYLQGNDKTCMSGKPAFGEVYNYILNYIYGQFTPNLKPYMAGEGGKTRAQWAQELYEYATDPERAQADATTDASNQVVKKNSHTLSCLTDAYFPDATALKAGEKRKQTLSERYAQVIACQVKDISRIYATSLDVGDMRDVIYRVLVKLWDYSANMPGDLAKLIHDAYAEMQVRRSAGIAQELGDLIDELAEAWKKSAGDSPSSWDHIAKWIADNPKWSSGLRAFWTFVGASCSVLIATIGTVYLFENWGSIDTEWKVFFISASFYHVLKAVKLFWKFGIDAKKWWANYQQYVEDGTMDLRLSESQEFFMTIEEYDAQVVEDVGKEVADELEQAFIDTGGEEELMSSVLAKRAPEQMGQQVAKTGNFSKFFATYFKGLVAVIGVVVVVICVVATVIQIVKEWNTEDKGLIALDILAAVAGFFEASAAACTIVGVEVALMGVMNIIPIVGQIAAVLGLVFFVIAAAIRGNKLDPVQLWVKNDGKPKLEAVNVPSADWLDKHPTNYDKVMGGSSGQGIVVGDRILCLEDDLEGLARALGAEADNEAAHPALSVTTAAGPTTQKACYNLGVWPFLS